MSRADWYVAWRARRSEDSVDRRAHAREIEACYRGQYAHDRLGWRARVSPALYPVRARMNHGRPIAGPRGVLP